MSGTFQGTGRNSDELNKWRSKRLGERNQESTRPRVDTSGNAWECTHEIVGDFRRKKTINLDTTNRAGPQTSNSPTRLENLRTTPRVHSKVTRKITPGMLPVTTTQLRSEGERNWKKSKSWQLQRVKSWRLQKK